MTADCIRHAVLDTYCEIYFSFIVFGRKWQVFFVFVYFSAEKQNLFFGYFYFTAEKVKFIFGRPLFETQCFGRYFQSTGGGLSA